jgi:hypothetical protein
VKLQFESEILAAIPLPIFIRGLSTCDWLIVKGMNLLKSQEPVQEFRENGFCQPNPPVGQYPYPKGVIPRTKAHYFHDSIGFDGHGFSFRVSLC